MSFSFISKVKFAGQYLKLLNNPADLENVVAINSTMVEIATDQQKLEVVRQIQKAPMGAAGITHRPRLGRVDLVALQALPKNTLGRNYFEFLKSNNLNPHDLPVFDPENTGDDFTFIRAHLFETHDIWHVVTGFGTDVQGELGLQAFYLTQFPAQMALVLMSTGFMHLIEQPIDTSRAAMEAIIRGYQMGKMAHDLVGRDWSKDWGTDLNELRRQVGIEIH